MSTSKAAMGGGSEKACKNSAKDGRPEKEESRNRGWPKGKKRYPKSPGAPKQPLSGYVHFLNGRREAVRKENPEMSFADISKKLAVEWSQVSAEVKQEYTARADADKERYSREFSLYQTTEEYKQFLEKQKEKESLKASKVGKEKKKKDSAKKVKKKQPKNLPPEAPLALSTSASGSSQTVMQPGGCEAVGSSLSGPTAGPPSHFEHNVDIPIFREEFLEHNKTREMELKQLRRQATEFEEQNAVLQKHVENMRSAITKLEHETAQQQEANVSLTKHLTAMRRLVVANFSELRLPNRREPLTMENSDSFMAHLKTLISERPRENEALIARAKEIATKMNCSSIPC